MSETLIFPEQTIEGFEYDSDAGFYLIGTTAPFAPKLGKTYRVVWDGKEYICKAYEGDYMQMGSTCYYLGNEMYLTGQSTEIVEPFVAMYIPANDWIVLVATDTETSHTMAVYEVDEESESEDSTTDKNSIVLYDRTGAAVVYEGIETLTTDTTVEGERVTFTRGVLMQDAEIDLAMAAGDQELSVPNGYLIKKAVLKKPETLSPENIKKNVDIAGVVGEFAGDEMEKTVDLFMADGDQIIEADKDTVLTKVTVKKPETLVPGNILEGVDIGGIIGTLVVPKLFALKSASKSKSNNLVAIYVYRYNQNGEFALRFQLVNSDTGEVLAEKDAGISLTSNNYIFGHEIPERPSAQPFHISARLVGNGFAPSDSIDISDDMFLTDIIYAFKNCISTFNYEREFAGSSVTMTLTADDGFYIPKAIEISDGNGEIEYVYDNFTGSLSFEVPQAEGITIQAIAPSIPWLHEPEFTLDSISHELTVDYIDENTESTPIICDGETIFTLEDLREGMTAYDVTSKPSGASYGFALQSDGYYKSANASTYTVGLCRVDFDMVTEGTVKLTYINYGYSSYDYGIVSKVDCELSNSYSTDIDTSSSNVYTTFKSSNSTTAKTLAITIPAGKHFIYLKYRRYRSSSSNYYFKFKVSTVPAEKTAYNLADYFPYGAHLLQVQSIAEGYTSSDIIELGVNITPIIHILDGVMTVSNLINATLVTVMVDGESVGVVECTDLEEIEIDLLQYNLSIAKHSVHVVVTDVEGDEWESNVVDDEICFTYTTFAAAEFSEIDAISRAGFASRLYTIGNTKSITLDGVARTIRIIDFNKDDLADGSGKAGITFCIYPLNYSSNLHDSSKWVSWTEIKPRKYLVDTFPSIVPEELQNIIKPVTKKYFYTDYVNNDAVDKIESCTDMWFIPSTEECGKTDMYTEGTGIQYEGLNTTSERIMKNDDGTAINWWTRTMTGESAWYIDTYGSVNFSLTTVTFTGTYYYILPCACI